MKVRMNGAWHCPMGVAWFWCVTLSRYYSSLSPDLSVSHLQLLLLVWHNFSTDTRRDLLLKCVKAVNRVAEEKGCVIISGCGQ